MANETTLTRYAGRDHRLPWCWLVQDGQIKVDCRDGLTLMSLAASPEGAAALIMEQHLDAGGQEVVEAEDLGHLLDQVLWVFERVPGVVVLVRDEDGVTRPEPALSVIDDLGFKGGEHTHRAVAFGRRIGQRAGADAEVEGL